MTAVSPDLLTFATTCDAVTYRADDDPGVRCEQTGTVEVRLSDGRWHLRCPVHVPRAVPMRGVAVERRRSA